MGKLDFAKNFEPEKYCIKDFNYWMICIRGKHPTLGDSVVLLKREIKSFADLKPEESLEFPSVINWYEKTCIKKFGAVRFNYTVMMMRDNYIHYHAFPRYDKSFSLFGIEWKDEDWPKAIKYKNGIELEDDVLFNIIDFMKD